MTDREPRSNRFVSDELHPTIYMAIVGLGLWFVLSAWAGFATDEYTGYLLVVVSGLVLVAVTIPSAIYGSRSARAGTSMRPRHNAVDCGTGYRGISEPLPINSRPRARRFPDPPANRRSRFWHDSIRARRASGRVRDHLIDDLRGGAVRFQLFLLLLVLLIALGWRDARHDFLAHLRIVLRHVHDLRIFVNRQALIGYGLGHLLAEILL